MTDKFKNSVKCHAISQPNKVFANLLNRAGVETSFEFNINAIAYDIKIKDKNVVIEIDPTYTHNVVGNHWGKSHINSKYHYDKSQFAIAHGFRCIHVFDWDDTEKLLKSIGPKYPIYARKCEIKQITKSGAESFTELYHMQGSCRGQEVAYGLYYRNELIQIMSFGVPRYNKNYQWELLRLCTKFGFYVVGGAEKLFKHFIIDYSPDSIISYCDVSKFSGDVYSRIGFKWIRNTTPNKIWSKKHMKITNNLLIQRGFDQLFGTDYGKGTDNEELMIKEGWLPVYDCGQASL